MTIKKQKTRNYLAMNAYMRNGGGPHKDRAEKRVNNKPWLAELEEELDEEQSKEEDTNDES